jgi:tRNA A-37 threonylcarbamoyl transferase component Bud32
MFERVMEKAISEATDLWVAEPERELFARHGLRGLADLFAVAGATRLDKAGLPSWRERLMLELEDGNGVARRFFVKRFASPPAGQRRFRLPKGPEVSSVAGVERHWLLSLAALGITVPRRVAFGEEIAAGREGRSALVLADVGGESLERWAGRSAQPAPRAWVDAVADLVRKFHGHGFVHRDLYLAHVFLTNAQSATPKPALIDLQRVMLAPLRWERWRARDLAQLDYSTPLGVASPRLRLRFLKRYLGGESLRSKPVRRLLRQIARRRKRIAAHDARLRARVARKDRRS